MGNLDDMPRTRFEYIYNHLFLPPKLPGADDASPKNEATLLDFLQKSLELFLPGRHDERAIRASISMIKFLRTSRNPQGTLREPGVREVLQGLSSQAPVAVLQITEQNAAVLMSRNPTSVLFEMFELSPTNQAAASNRSRLVRRFPATAVEIALCDFDNEDFRTVFTKTLTKMSQQLVRETRQMVNKGKNEQTESMETADPMIVTELFASILRGCGKEVAAKGIRKKTREDVMGKGSKPPWRRSSLWLLLRVALQLSMTRLSGENDNTYKEFMPFLLAQALQDANRQQKIVSDVLNIMSTKVSRRLCKLRDPSDGPWLLSIRHIVSKTSETLHERWEHIRERAEPPPEPGRAE